MAKNDNLAAIEGTLGAGALTSVLMAEGLVTEGGIVATNVAQLGVTTGMTAMVEAGSAVASSLIATGPVGLGIAAIAGIGLIGCGIYHLMD